MYSITNKKKRLVASSLMIAMAVLMLSSTLSSSLMASTIDTSSDHSTLPASEATSPSPSMSSLATPAIQVALSSLTARPTNNIVNTNSFYDVVFLTATTGAIKTIEVIFPAGTTIPSGAFFNEAEGIGPGTASKSGQTIIYTVTNAVNVPAGTKIRLEFANINNPLNPSSAYQVTVTTRNAANAIIDGPSQSTAYTIKQIGTNAIADNSITSTKPAESFMKRVTVLDDDAGHAVGWNPGGGIDGFNIQEPSISSDIDNSFFAVEVFANVELGGAAPCRVLSHDVGAHTFRIFCEEPPLNGDELHYVVGNLPEHVICGPGLCRQ